MTDEHGHSANDAGALEAAARGRGLLALVVPLALAGLVAAGAAVWTLAATGPSAATLGGLGLMLCAAMLAEAYPVQMEGLPAGNVSLAAVFVVAAGLIYGWPAAAIVAFGTRTALELAQRRPLIRLAANGAVYALAGAAAGRAEQIVPDRTGTIALFAAVLLGASAFYLVNVLLIAAIVSLATGDPLPRVLARLAYFTIVPFAIMASVSMILYVLWDRSPSVASALVGPLVAIVLYERSIHRTLAATRLALTDGLTGLGNQRHFRERLEADLDRAIEEGRPLTLCLIDVDDFKRVNDTFGHPVGDVVLGELASKLRQGGEAFRLGGDEFAILLPGHGAQEGLRTAVNVAERMSRVSCPDGTRITVSAGVATFPGEGVGRSELQRVADAALYRAKHDGKNTVRAYRPGVVMLESRREERTARLARRLADRLGVPESEVAAALEAESSAQKVPVGL